MKLRSIRLDKINIQDSFWSKHVSLVRDSIIPYQWDAMNDRIPGADPSHCLENFRIAAGLKEGEFYGAVFQDTDIAKWLEAVGFTLSTVTDEELEKTADEVIDLIAKAQCPDGYLNTYFTIKEPDKRWSDLAEGHELYTAGHMMEAASAYYYGTGKRKFLDVMLRFADLICETFGEKEGQIHGYPGHQEVEIGLIKLYEITQNETYVETAKYFIDARGVGENYFLNEMKRPGFQYIFPEFRGYQPEYSQSHLPVREQKTAEGHAVRAVYMYCAMADLADAYQDAALLAACKTLWNNMTAKRMYLTGGIGSSGIMERFTIDYDLPNDYNYSESCASIGLALFGLRMANITKEAKYVDVVERALYNTVLAGIALDGKSFFYVNPLEVWPDSCIERTSKEHVKPIRQKWFGVACCPPNIARTLASLGQYIYSVDDESIYVNLFISNETQANIGGKDVHLKLETRFPIENTFSFHISDVPEQGLNLFLRIPEYAKNYKIYAHEGRRAKDGGTVVPVTYENAAGYASVRVEKDCVFEVEFDAMVHFVRSNPLVRADSGKVAIVRGPVVYCLEEIDNGSNLPSIYVDTRNPAIEEYRDILGGIVGIRLRGKKISGKDWPEHQLYGELPLEMEDVELQAIPYAYWNNRGIGEMCVWLKELWNVSL